MSLLKLSYRKAAAKALCILMLVFLAVQVWIAGLSQVVIYLVFASIWAALFVLSALDLHDRKGWTLTKVCDLALTVVSALLSLLFFYSLLREIA